MSGFLKTIEKIEVAPEAKDMKIKRKIMKIKRSPFSLPPPVYRPLIVVLFLLFRLQHGLKAHP